jgi:hypothetical protein
MKQNFRIGKKNEKYLPREAVFEPFVPRKERSHGGSSAAPAPLNRVLHITNADPITEKLMSSSKFSQRGSLAAHDGASQEQCSALRKRTWHWRL